MTSRSQDDDFLTHTRRARIAHWIDRGCRAVFRLSFDGVLLSCIGFFLYVGIGLSGRYTGIWTPDYPVLLLTSDPYFAGLAFACGCFLCGSTGSFVVITTSFRRDENAFSILWALIGFGFGASVVRWTAPVVVRSVMASVPW